MPRLRALCAAWVSYLERQVFPGGCFFVAAAHEFDGRPGGRAGRGGVALRRLAGAAAQGDRPGRGRRRAA
ncbi:TetR family transcriptional regulator C-terminal domain-containing protein [Nonomuraea salmonea]|uniref:TetR family transcriptional regulator C-terminal domain-containing protein n=1 Tax=Nonomuraea salmonea TaxID=46181 RepID=UPI003CD0BC12